MGSGAWGRCLGGSKGGKRVIDGGDRVEGGRGGERVGGGGGGGGERVGGGGG